VIDAEKKEIMTPHHIYSTDVSAGTGKGGEMHEMISTGGATYILYHGTWRKSPMGPKESLQQLEENLANAKSVSCQRLPDETVGGVRAAVYQTHEGEEVKVDARTWVAGGLVLRQEEDMDVGEGMKRHMSLRYDYTNVQPPAGVK
jgi:hypothetical protein